MSNGDSTVEQPEVSGYEPTGASSSLKRDPQSVKTVDEMRLSELLKLSGSLARVRTLDVGTVVLSVGVGLAGAAIGAAATGEPLLEGVPLFCLAFGLASVVLGYFLSHDRGEEIGAIRKNLDFDIDSWCHDDDDAAEMRDRYKKAMKSPSLAEAGLERWRNWKKKE
jgi:hypothetical protein